MDRFEQGLRDALRRKDAPADLTAKVLARVHAKSDERGWQRWFRGPVLASTLAAALVVAAIGIAAERRHTERVAGEEARRQVVLALRIASSKLQLAETKVQELSDKTQE
ncbi:MAG: hypothetical protein ACRD3E_07050 [Terriglobales bacterium]